MAPARPRRSRRSSARAAARWRTCVRWSACCATTRRRLQPRRSRRSLSSKRCSFTPRAPTRGWKWRETRACCPPPSSCPPIASSSTCSPRWTTPRLSTSAFASGTTCSSSRSPVAQAGARRPRSSVHASARGCTRAGSRQPCVAAAPRRGSHCVCSWWPEVTARRAELLVGLAAGAIGAASASVEGLGAVGLASGAVVGGALGAVRAHPRAAWLVAVAALLTTAPVGVSVGVALLVVAHAFCAGRWETRGAGFIALAALVGALELAVLLANDSGEVPALLLPAAGWGAGRALCDRELVAARLAERARELQEEREAHAALSARYERARIASELHDIVAHAISVMVIQASAGQRLATRDPKATAETFKAIAGAARQAEHDMQRLVALLGDEDAIGPAPDLALIEELVARAASNGLAVTLHLDGDFQQLPAPVAQTAY